ncbi:MAG TPA: hypothetical protein VGP87_10040 [Gemmatimonadales bacterium]|nr:hypothetical protein [Gemmatimonadales bacterium]
MSKRWTGLAALAVSLSVVWLVFIVYGSPWLGLTWVVSLAFTAALWANRRASLSTQSIGQVLGDLESQPVAAAATSMRTDPAPKTVL